MVPFKIIILDPSHRTGDDGIVTPEIVSSIMKGLLSKMKNLKHPEYDNFVMNMNRGYDITMTKSQDDLKTLDHYLLDHDVVCLAVKNYPEEFKSGVFFDDPAYVYQYFDPSRTMDDIKAAFDLVNTSEILQEVERQNISFFEGVKLRL